jgi:hypothetical protein
MGKIFEETRTETPLKRNIIADRVLALVHIKHYVVDKKAVLIPAVWRQTPGGAKALIAEGRASLLPNNSKKGSSIGRYWFAQELIKKTPGHDRDLESKIISKAIAWDMEGI